MDPASLASAAASVINRANQLNPNNIAYWLSRGFSARPDNWASIVAGTAGTAAGTAGAAAGVAAATGAAAAGGWTVFSVLQVASTTYTVGKWIWKLSQRSRSQ